MVIIWSLENGNLEDGFPVLFLRLLHILVSEVPTGEPGNQAGFLGDELHRPQATVETSREPLVEPNAQDDHGMTMG